MNRKDRLLTTDIEAGDLAIADMFIPYIFAIVSNLTSVSFQQLKMNCIQCIQVISKTLIYWSHIYILSPKYHLGHTSIDRCCSVTTWTVRQCWISLFWSLVLSLHKSKFKLRKLFLKNFNPSMTNLLLMQTLVDATHNLKLFMFQPLTGSHGLVHLSCEGVLKGSGNFHW
jgi:hypothetical protein